MIAFPRWETLSFEVKTILVEEFGLSYESYKRLCLTILSGPFSAEPERDAYTLANLPEPTPQSPPAIP